MKRWDLTKTKIKFLTASEFSLVTAQPLHYVNLLISNRQLASQIRVRKEPQPLIPIIELARYQDGEIRIPGLLELLKQNHKKTR